MSENKRITEDVYDEAYCLATEHDHRSRADEAICSLWFQLGNARCERDEARAMLAGVRLNLPEEAWIKGMNHAENVFHFVAGAKHELNLAQMEVKVLKAKIEEILEKRDSRGFKRGA